MFNLITRMIKSPKNNVHTFVKVSLPAVDGEDTNGNWKAVVDPNVSAQDILDTLLENWTDDEVKDHMFSRFIAVLADDPIRNDMIAFIKANPEAKQEEIDSHSQAFADAGWNINLKHPATDRSVKSVEKKQEKAEKWVSEMTKHQQLEFMLKLAVDNPSLKETITAQLKEAGGIEANNVVELLENSKPKKK